MATISVTVHTGDSFGDGVRNGADYTYDQVEVDISPTDKRLSGSKWKECALCGWVDREASMSRVGGRFYCNKNGCAAEKSAGSAK